MKFDINGLLRGSRDIFNSRIRGGVSRIIEKVKTEIIDYPEKKERNRRLIILFASLFLLDYLMYCLHAGKNILDIFPSPPSLDSVKNATLYLPSLDGKSIFAEKRRIPAYDSDEKSARELFDLVARGSLYENTAQVVPVELFVNRVWIYGKNRGKGRICVFDIDPVKFRGNVEIIKNSEDLFGRALEKTIIANIPSIKKVLILEKGIPGTRLWEQ